MTDTAPDSIDPATLPDYEPPVEGETTRERRARKARNRRRAEKVQRAAAEPEPGAKPVGRPSAKGKREQAVLGILTGVGIAVMVVDEYDGTVIIEGAPDLAKSLANVAEKRPAVAKALDALTETSAWAEVAVAAAGIVVPIVRHHARPPELATPADTATAGVAVSDEPTPQVAPDAPVFTVAPEPTADPVPTFRAQA